MKKNLFVTLTLFLFSLFFAAPAFAQADAVSPSEVTGVTAKAKDAEVTLQWTAATDNVAVKGYKVHYGTHSVNAASEAQYETEIDVKNVTTYTVKNLANETTYYFAVLAYDAAGNESEFFSSEVSATPVKGELPDESETSSTPQEDTVAPTVVAAAATASTQVAVTFSEPVMLPIVNPASAFTIQEYASLELISVMSVASGPTPDSILVTTQEQKAGIEYLLTVGINVEDKAGNPIVSGTSDTALFIGSDKKITPPSEAAEISTPQEFKIAKLETPDQTTVKITFSKPVALSLEPLKNFTIHEKTDPSVLLEITAVELSDDDLTVTLTTALQEGKSYSANVTGLIDVSGATHPSVSKEFMGKATLFDLTPPEDITELVGKILSSVAVRLKWKASVNSAGDLADQLLYQSADGGNSYGSSFSLGKTATKYDAKSLKPGQEYHMKVTTKDTSGNESSGMVIAIKLPATGAGIGILILASFGLGNLFRRKK